MNWIKLTKENQPDTEVLAGNFEAGTYGFKEKIVGYVFYDDRKKEFIAESDHQVLENVTHFVDLSKFDPIE